jgi:hypothetical protein
MANPVWKTVNRALTPPYRAPLSQAIVLISGPIFGWLADRGRQEVVLLVRSFGNIVSSIVYILAPNLVGFTK